MFPVNTFEIEKIPRLHLVSELELLIISSNSMKLKIANCHLREIKRSMTIEKKVPPNFSYFFPNISKPTIENFIDTN